MDKKKITKLIPTGREDAILLRDLSSLLNMDTRQVQREIQALRDDGEVILSASTGGYYYPTNDKEGVSNVKEFIGMMEGQAKSRLYRVQAAKQWLQDYQQVDT